MARFTDLPVEIQTEIWMLVLPAQGGVHWIEFEGYPLRPDAIKKSLERLYDFFNDKEPINSAEHSAVSLKHYELNEYYWDNAINGINDTPFFKFLYSIIPSVWGRSRGLMPTKEGDILAPEVLDEIATTRRCRQLSTYTQITTLLSICRISRLTVLNYLHNMVDVDCSWDLYRGVGPLSRPRPISTWRQQYKNDWLDDGYYLPYYTPQGKPLVPVISPIFDLVVYRLHTSSGHATPILNHAYFQFNADAASVKYGPLPIFGRVGIEWHPLWATPEGRKEFREEAVFNLIRCSGPIITLSTALYWLVDGIPRPQWDQYPPAIPDTFNRVIVEWKYRPARPWLGSDPQNHGLLRHHDLYQEFEANGRRYYIVFVVYEWMRPEGWPQELPLDPSVSWDGPFPGGEDLWPEALRAPARLAYDVLYKTGTFTRCTYVLSWEPI